jgi:choline monooxygenase
VHKNQIEKPGSYALAKLGEFEVIVTRDSHNSIHAFRNMCLHRGSRLIECDGMGTTLVCPYHSWSYASDGSLRKAPGFEDDARVTAKHSRIESAKVAWLGPLLFASLASDPVPFADVVKPLKDIFADSPPLQREDSRQYVYNCNWKTAIENSLECYHCPTIHPGFNSLTDLKNYLWEVQGYCAITGGELKIRAKSEVYSAAVSGEDIKSTGRYYYIWPNLHLLRYPGPPNLAVARWLPRGIDQTVCVRDFYFSEAFDGKQRKEFLAYVEEIQRQDIRACENVNVNVRTGAFQRSVLRLVEDGMGEHGIRQFQRLLLDALSQHTQGQPPLRASAAE